LISPSHPAAGHTPQRFNSRFTMFVYLNGHRLLEYYFAVSDTRLSANDAGHSGPDTMRG
jgi:hypothetical protein